MSAIPQSSFLYFAYGSNMLTRRLSKRTASATKVCTGVLPAFEIRWHMMSADGSGKCDVTPASGTQAEVHGVLYRIPIAEKPALDAAETLGTGYEQKEVAIQTAQGVVSAWLYYALTIDPATAPYDWYHAIVLAGAREHGLPASYVAQLEQVRARPDPDLARATLNFGLVNAI